MQSGKEEEEMEVRREGEEERDIAVVVFLLLPVVAAFEPEFKFSSSSSPILPQELVFLILRLRCRGDAGPQGTCGGKEPTVREEKRDRQVRPRAGEVLHRE